MKITLGSAQFGADYGAFNPAGRVEEAEVARILDHAHAAGITLIDTARAYGQSEAVLGALKATERFDLITKCPPLPDDAGQAADMLADMADQSLRALGTARLHGYMLHRADDLLGPAGDAIWAGLEALRDQGSTARIGVSVYDAATLNAVRARYPVDIAQIPANVLDTGWRDARAEGLELHGRSAFLQGFLLSDPTALSPWHARWATPLANWQTRAAQAGQSPLQAALGPMLNAQGPDQVVIGVNTSDQLDAILAATRDASTGRPAYDTEAFDAPADLIDPRRWPSKTGATR